MNQLRAMQMNMDMMNSMYMMMMLCIRMGKKLNVSFICMDCD
ncbi:MAG: hypothetical protein ACLR0U_18495 [Enterocloster clostridioformis]